MTTRRRWRAWAPRSATTWATWTTVSEDEWSAERIEGRRLDREAQRIARTADCPLCRVPAGAVCLNIITREPMHLSVSHWQRIREGRRLALSGMSEGITT